MNHNLTHFLTASLLKYSAFLSAFFFAFSMNAQSCEYRVELNDLLGDGWNGAVLTVTVNGVSSDFTINAGTFAAFDFVVNPGDEIILNYSAGNFDSENTYVLMDSDGVVLYADGPFPTVGEVFTTIGDCPDCPRPSPDDLNAVNPDDDSVNLIWGPSLGAQSYIVEYGPSGFPVGFGQTKAVNPPFTNLSGLNACVNYDVYVYAVCGQDSISQPSGPLSFSTTWSDNPVSGPCNFTINQFAANGFGWGGQLIVTVNGVSQFINFFFGFQQTTIITANAGDLISIEYVSGFDDPNNTYEVLDNNGTVVFNDGPSPQIGKVFQTVACATCNIPGNFRMADLNADNAKIRWDLAEDPTGDFEIEYGSLGFTKGDGTIITVPSDVNEAVLSGLTENTYYDVYIQTVCDTSNRSKPIGPITFQTIWFKDVGVVGINNPSAENCTFSSDEKVEILINNFGQKPQTLFNFRYAVNGVPAPIPHPQDGFYTGVIGNDSIQYIEFETEWDFSEPGYYLIEAWTELEDDSDVSNDTFAFEIITAYPKPLMEDFESEVWPENWTTSAGEFVHAPNAHNNPTALIGQNIYSGIPNWDVTTHRVGLIEDGDVFSFDYRYVDWFDGTNPTTLGPNDRLDVQISDDCGDTFTTVYTVDSDNHITSLDLVTVEIDLTDYVGKAITIRFEATWGSGDYWLDLDNINIPGCPGDFGLFANSVVTHEVDGVPTGSIDAIPLFGTAPYDFQWNTGAQTSKITNLPAGFYSVTITDANGCMDEHVFEVNSITPTFEEVEINEMKLYPNPTSGIANLEISLSKTSDVTVQVFNSAGIQVFENQQNNVSETIFEINLENPAAGMYFVRVMTESQTLFERLMVSN